VLSAWTVESQPGKHLVIMLRGQTIENKITLFIPYRKQKEYFASGRKPQLSLDFKEETRRNEYNTTQHNFTRLLTSLTQSI